MANLEWERLSSEYVIEQRPWFALTASRYRLPDGQQIWPYYMVEYADWVTVLALTRRVRLSWCVNSVPAAVAWRSNCRAA